MNPIDKFSSGFLLVISLLFYVVTLALSLADADWHTAAFISLMSGLYAIWCRT